VENDERPSQSRPLAPNKPSQTFHGYVVEMYACLPSCPRRCCKGTPKRFPAWLFHLIAGVSRTPHPGRKCATTD
jgi:hypothetical protein